MNKQIVRGLGLIVLGMLWVVGALSVQAESPYNIYESNTFLAKDTFQRYYPPKMNRLIASLPEYQMFGPGYICETRQPPPVYRFPIQYNRHIGYREADWSRNMLWDQHGFLMNYGGYTY